MAVLGVQLHAFRCPQTLLPRCTGDGISKRQSRHPRCSEPRDYFFFPSPLSSLGGISFLLGSVNSASLSFGYSGLSILQNSSSIHLFCKLLLRFDALKNESQKDLQNNSTLVLTRFPWGSKQKVGDQLELGERIGKNTGRAKGISKHYLTTKVKRKWKSNNVISSLLRTVTLL